MSTIKKEQNGQNIEKVVGKNVILFMKENKYGRIFRFSGVVKTFDGTFIELFDDVKQKIKMINISEVAEIEIS